MADLSSRNMRFKEFMLCRSAYWDLGEQIHAGGFCRLGAVPCALAHSGISAASCLSAWLWSLEVHGDVDPSMARVPWSDFWGKRASNPLIQCQPLQYHLFSCSLVYGLFTWEHSSLVAPPRALREFYSHWHNPWTECETQPVLGLGPELPRVSVLGRNFSPWMSRVAEEMRRRIALGVMACPHFSLLQEKTNGLGAPRGFSCHSASLIPADVQASACSESKCLSVQLTRDRQEILHAQK